MEVRGQLHAPEMDVAEGRKRFCPFPYSNPNYFTMHAAAY
jgi:hypothetical protein